MRKLFKENAKTALGLMLAGGVALGSGLLVMKHAESTESETEHDIGKGLVGIGIAGMAAGGLKDPNFSKQLQVVQRDHISNPPSNTAKHNDAFSIFQDAAAKIAKAAGAVADKLHIKNGSKNQVAMNRFRHARPAEIDMTPTIHSVNRKRNTQQIVG